MKSNGATGVELGPATERAFMAQPPPRAQSSQPWKRICWGWAAHSPLQQQQLIDFHGSDANLHQ